MALDSANGIIPQERSEIVTLLPFESNHKNKKRRKFKADPTLIHFDSIFGANNWSRFIVLKTESRISPLVLENKLLSSYPTREMCFRPQKTNEWLIEATTKAQSDIFLSIKEIQGIKVTVKSHDMLNYVQGTVVLPQLHDDEQIPDKSILLESLKLRYDNIHDIEVYEIPSRKDDILPTRIAKIKFVGQDLPQKIKVLGQNREVRPYVPKPLQCRQCCKFGHTHKVCQNKEICVVCGSEEHTTDWNCPDTKCSNCGQPHHAKSKECPFYIYNTELKLLMSRTGMAVREAKLELKVRGILDPGRNPSYKNLLKSKMPQRPESDADLQSIPHKPVINTNNRFEILDNLNTEPTQQFHTITVEIHARPAVSSPLKCEDKKTKIPTNKAPNNELLLETETNKRRRELSNGTPPKPKKPNTKESISQNNKVSESLKIQTELECQEGDHSQPHPTEIITPSPIIGKTGKTLNRSHPLSTGIDSIQQKSKHHSSCGCHQCFINLLHETNPVTSSSLTVMMNNFIRFRTKNKKEELRKHPEDCMCAGHLSEARAASTQKIQNLLEKIKQKQKSQGAIKKKPNIKSPPK